MSVGKDQHDGIRIAIAIVAALIIAAAVYISKRRPVAIGEEAEAPTGAAV